MEKLKLNINGINFSNVTYNEVIEIITSNLKQGYVVSIKQEKDKIYIIM